MSDIATAIYAQVTGDTTVTALISDRLYPEYDRQADRIYPLAVYTTNISPNRCFDGPSGIESAVIRIAAVATTYKEATEVANAIKSALDSQSGTWAGVVVQGTFMQEDGVKDDVVTEPTTEEILYFVKSLSFDVIYES